MPGQVEVLDGARRGTTLGPDHFGERALIHLTPRKRFHPGVGPCDVFALQGRSFGAERSPRCAATIRKLAQGATGRGDLSDEAQRGAFQFFPL